MYWFTPIEDEPFWGCSPVLMMSAKLATPGLLKIEIFKNKGYDVTNKVLSRDSNYIVDVVM